MTFFTFFRISRHIDSDDWRQKFWSRDENEVVDVGEKRRPWSSVDKRRQKTSKFDADDDNDVVDVKKSSTVLTRRRFPDGIGVLRLSFSSPGEKIVKYFFSFIF